MKEMTLHAGENKYHTTNAELCPGKNRHQDKNTMGLIRGTRPIEGPKPGQQKIRIRRTCKGKQCLRTVECEEDVTLFEGAKSVQQNSGGSFNKNPRTTKKQRAADAQRLTDMWVAIPTDRDTLTTTKKSGYKIGEIPQMIPTTVIHIPPRDMRETMRQPREWTPMRGEITNFGTMKKNKVSLTHTYQPKVLTHHGIYGHKDDNEHRKCRHGFHLDPELVRWISENPTRLTNARRDMEKWAKYMANAMQNPAFPIFMSMAHSFTGPQRPA